MPLTSYVISMHVLMYTVFYYVFVVVDITHTLQG